MAVERLRVESLRIIRSLDLELGGRPALFFGGNGAGKTTLLEAIYLLARGRSFRGVRSGDVISVGSDGTRIVGDIRVGDCGSNKRLSFERVKATGIRGHGAGEVASKRDRALGFPVRLVGEASGSLLDGEPAIRRGFLDLNLFHVEQRGEPILRRFRRVLGQRNAWLRAGGHGRPAWDAEFVAAATELDEARRRFCLATETEFQAISGRIEFLDQARLVYFPGWKAGASLAQALSEDGAGERSAGFTRVGPQRADFRVGASGPRQGWSRGQAKAIVCLLQLASDRVQQRTSGIGSVWLLDDLWADLDEATGRAISQLVGEHGGQCLFARVSEQAVSQRSELPTDTRLFHVKQGAVTPVA